MGVKAVHKGFKSKIPTRKEQWSKNLPGSGEEGSSRAAEASLLRMEVNTLVYACGDKFGIRVLKAAATKKFARSIVFRVTAPGDSELRSELLLLYIRHREAVTCDLAKKMVEHEPLTWKVYLEMRAALDAEKERFARLEDKLDARNAEIKEKDADLRDVRRKLDSGW
ncbi:hypothetical protein GJ744_007642 [Endocarpon pusillum]|uniref:Uncharacterized protein n=1 Tax=Endocarpon pusillum TaxID=364733 RepID=A0A8H7E3Y3_9EURO|nr:hypothetical protein GJ744_007642 [Endocarpon pusillum]